MDTGNDIAIRAVDLAKHYRSGETDLIVFSGLGFEVRRGERLAIVGESGAGKSTLLHLLGGLDRPSNGTIHFGAKEITALPDTELADFRNREIGFVWQIHYLLPEFTALENVMMPALIRRTARGEARRAAQEMLQLVGLSERMAHKPGELSGGEQQRVALARALCLQPRLLLADEPTGNLDPATADGIHRLLQELNATLGITMVIVTHNEVLAETLPRRLRLSAGRLV